jgi:hypothetical protein
MKGETEGEMRKGWSASSVVFEGAVNCGDERMSKEISGKCW